MRASLGKVALWLLASFVSVRGGIIFTDDFSGGGGDGWGNERGAWLESGGVYNASSLNNNPPTYSSALTVALSDFIASVDVNSVDDGGLWLRSSFSGGKASGVLLVTGGAGGTYNGVYWHTVSNDVYSASFGAFAVPGLQSSNAAFTVTVTGDLYEVYLNGSFLTSQTIAGFDSGHFGLYDFSSTQSFDNVVISVVPEPACLVLLAAGLAAMAGLGRRRPRRLA